MFGYVKKTKAADFLIKAMQQISLSSYSAALPRSQVIYNYGNSIEQIDAYATIDDLYSIVNKLDGICKSIPLYAYEVKDQKAMAKYRIMDNKIRKSKNYNNKNIADLAELQSKAMEIIGDNDQLQKILDNPNEFESKDEFYSALFTFPFLTGNDYVVKDLLQEGANKNKPFQLFHLSPSFTNIVPSSSLPRYATQYKYNLYGTDITFERDQIMHRKYFNPVYDYAGTELYGLSPLTAAAKRLSQASNESNYANQSLVNAGAEGFISNEDADFNIETFGSVKEDVLKELGSARNRDGNNLNARKLALLLGKWKYNQIGISPVDMQLLEMGKVTFKKLCNIYGISDRLFNNDATGSEISIDKMLRDAFISVGIPEVSAVKDMFNRQLTPLYTDKKRFIDYDISDVTQLQEDINSVVARFENMPGYKPNDLREAQGFGRDLGPSGEVFVHKQGYVTLDELIVNPITDTSALNAAKANDYNK